jgi:hypothetical protein
MASLPASPLLAIDQNRSTVIDRIVSDWGEAIRSAGLSAEQLRELLHAMRSDQLLAASLAGSLDGLRNVVSASLLAETGVKPSLLHAKNLGDGNRDVVYVPVTPCRLVETRGTFPAVFQGGGPFAPTEVRTYKVEGANGVCLSQLPASVSPSALQVQVFALPAASGSGDVEMLPQGAAFGSTSTLVFVGNVSVTTVSTTTLVNPANKQISVQVRGGTLHLAIDVVGYFRSPAVDNALEINVNNSRVMRYEANPISPNVIGGSPANNVTAGVRGATIGGGGVPSGGADPNFTNEAPNRVTDAYGTVSGGYGNQAGDGAGTVTDRAFATVGGGQGNIASGAGTTVSGGETNTASGDRATVAGGTSNTASGEFATVGGGLSNLASGASSFVGGGSNNTAGGHGATIAGGSVNTADGDYGFVAAGRINHANGDYSSVLAGLSNVTSGRYAVAWGLESEARGDFSVAIGRRAKTFVNANNAVGTFVWADSNDFDFATTTENRFQVRATGGVYFVTAINATGGAAESFFVSPSGDVTSTGEINAVAFNPTSDRNAKQDFAPVDNDAVLAAVASLPLASWSYRSDPHATRHIGPTAQDFRAAFDVGRDDKSIATVDADGVALAAIQALNAKVAEQAREIAELRRAVEALSPRISR